MEGYLGEKIVNVKDTEFKDFTSSDWAMYYIERYGQIDGGHHKQWVLDQVSRILNGTKVIVKLATWENGESEYRIETDVPSVNYTVWVNKMLGKHLVYEDIYEYEYDYGIAP